VYVTNDLSDLGNALTPSSGTYLYTFSAPGTYYIVALDSSDSDTADYCASAERIVVNDSVMNAAPTLKIRRFLHSSS
jgi:hypothetical protein